ncbi:MAG: hypothetical protein V4596_11655 [Bdellovibrionota bacterium]
MKSVLTVLLGTILTLTSSCNTKPVVDHSFRNLASDSNYFSPRNIQYSPYKNINTIEYAKLIPGLKEYIARRPEKLPFMDQDQRWQWANLHAIKNKKHFSILNIVSDTSAATLLKRAKEKDPVILEKFGYVLSKDWFKHKKDQKLFAYQIFNEKPKNKPTVLIWAKEHGDELGTAEFTTQLTEFFLFHLQGLGNPIVNKTIQDLFSKITIVVVPDMTPDKNFIGFKNKITTVQDFNGFGILLQPFEYDSNDPENYIGAPEAIYLKKLMLSLSNVVLGIDIHSPFGVSVIAAPDNSVAEKNRYLIAEGTNTTKCLAQLTDHKKPQACQTGVFQVAHPGISAGVEISASFFSRTKKAPSILLELETGIPDDYVHSEECYFGHKEGTCEYYVKPHLQEQLPFFIRIMEIISQSPK